MDTLDIERRTWGRHVVVAAVGQIDVATAPQLRQALTEAQMADDGPLVLDLDGVEFLDSFGLGVILGALKRARAQGGELRIVCARERLRHLFALTGLDQIVEVADTLDQLDD